MKKHFYTFLMGMIAAGLLGACALGLRAATAGPTWTQQYIYPTFIGSNPAYVPPGQTATSAPFQSIWFGHFTNNDTPPQTAEIQTGTASVDILDAEHAGLSYTFDGVKATNAQIYGLLNASMAAAYNSDQAAAKTARQTAAKKK